MLSFHLWTRIISQLGILAVDRYLRGTLVLVHVYESNPVHHIRRPGLQVLLVGHTPTSSVPQAPIPEWWEALSDAAKDQLAG